MSSFSLDGRARLSIALALFDGNRDVPLPPERETEARRLGLCGAEVDAARRGRSFDARMSRALALALAAASRDGGRLHEERAWAVWSGIPAEVCREIESLAVELAGDGAAPDPEPTVARKG
ncbi:hypothetical protein [Methylobacterium symbioticum]|uniref:Uncharacterized protein n=1 Tax=Methylobacterium symbioticum TaxID=2584084 RepID=A0A509EBX2_9HYPH|nr:hypothetical protein [Methylobacterium symbioticum]VUD71747.1 hypothetical protein MET9862_02335 [Methylobacterium symbioticum]